MALDDYRLWTTISEWERKIVIISILVLSWMVPTKKKVTLVTSSRPDTSRHNVRMLLVSNMTLIRCYRSIRFLSFLCRTVRFKFCASMLTGYQKPTLTLQPVLDNVLWLRPYFCFLRVPLAVHHYDIKQIENRFQHACLHPQAHYILFKPAIFNEARDWGFLSIQLTGRRW